MNVHLFQHRSFELKLACNEKTQSQDLAWNQADAYLLQQLELLSAERTAIACINDSYGVLTLAARQAEYSVSFYSDSAISRRWLESNTKLNHLDPSEVYDIPALINAKADIYLLRLPKNLQYFKYLLSSLSQKTESTIIIAGMQKHWPATFYQISYDFFEHVDVLPGVKKAKCMVLRGGKKIKNVDVTVEGYHQEFDIFYRNYPNVFSREKLDMGSRFFLENLPTLKTQQTLLDLACGNGLLGLSALKKSPQLTAVFIDESAFALQSCSDSLALNGIEIDRYSLLQADVIEDLSLKKVDVVFCNPPFHQLHHVSTDIAERMIKAAAITLNKGGNLFMIANNHLPYKPLLKRYFDTVSIKNKNSKFIIYQAIKGVC